MHRLETSPFSTPFHILNVQGATKLAIIQRSLKRRLLSNKKGLPGSSGLPYFILCSSKAKVAIPDTKRKKRQVSFINYDLIWTKVELQSERNALNRPLCGLTVLKLVVYKLGLLSAAEVIFCSVTLQNTG